MEASTVHAYAPEANVRRPSPCVIATVLSESATEWLCVIVQIGSVYPLEASHAEISTVELKISALTFATMKPWSPHVPNISPSMDLVDWTTKGSGSKSNTAMWASGTVA